MFDFHVRCFVDSMSFLLFKFGHCKFALFVNSTREILKKRLEERCENSNRIDDNQENIDSRIKIFFNQTLAVLDYYEQQNVEIPEV